MEFRPVALELRTFVEELVGGPVRHEQRCPIKLSLIEMPAEIQGDERSADTFSRFRTNAVKYSDAGRAVEFEITRVGGNWFARSVTRASAFQKLTASGSLMFSIAVTTSMAVRALVSVW